MLGLVTVAIELEPIDSSVAAGDVIHIENLGADHRRASGRAVGELLERGRQDLGGNPLAVDQQLNLFFTRLAAGPKGHELTTDTRSTQNRPGRYGIVE